MNPVTPIRPVTRHRSPVDMALIIVQQPGRSGLVGRVVWSRCWHGAVLHLYTGLTGRRRLTERQQLQAIRRATEVLERRLGDDDGYCDSGALDLRLDELDRSHDPRTDDLPDVDALSQAAQPPPSSLDQLGTGARYPECVRCGHTFAPESSPHDELCWVCAELDEAEGGSL